MSFKVDFLIREYGAAGGQARYNHALYAALKLLEVDVSWTELELPRLVRAAGRPARSLDWDLAEFFRTFPVTAPVSSADLIHLSTQQFATLLALHRIPGPVVITVHDIIPYLNRSDPEQRNYDHKMEAWFDRLALRGLKNATAIIAITEFTKQTLLDTVFLPEEKIDVVLYGIDRDVFKPTPVSNDFWQKYRLSQNDRHVLYVGSEIPRKNLPRLVRAFAQVAAQIDNVKFIKLGTPIDARGYQELKQTVRDCGIEDIVCFIDHPPEHDLVSFYNMADVFVFPSLFEGFGMPPLEAMSCGTPVISSNAASLPEVVGDAGILFDPYSEQEMAEAMLLVLRNHDLCRDLRKKGLAHAKQFSWKENAKKTLAVYEKANANFHSG